MQLRAVTVIVTPLRYLGCWRSDTSLRLPILHSAKATRPCATHKKGRTGLTHKPEHLVGGRARELEGAIDEDMSSPRAVATKSEAVSLSHNSILEVPTSMCEGILVKEAEIRAQQRLVGAPQRLGEDHLVDVPAPALLLQRSAECLFEIFSLTVSSFLV